MGVVEIIGAFLSVLAAVLPMILTAWVNDRNAQKKVAHDLAELERKQTMDAMAAVDAELDGVQPDQREPILLSSDDHL